MDYEKTYQGFKDLGMGKKFEHISFSFSFLSLDEYTAEFSLNGVGQHESGCPYCNNSDPNPNEPTPPYTIVLGE